MLGSSSRSGDSTFAVVAVGFLGGILLVALAAVLRGRRDRVERTQSYMNKAPVRVALAELAKRYEPGVTALDDEIKASARQIARLNAEMDRLARES